LEIKCCKDLGIITTFLTYSDAVSQSGEISAVTGTNDNLHNSCRTATKILIHLMSKASHRNTQLLRTAASLKYNESSFKILLKIPC